MEEFLAVVADMGRRYGLELHPDKLQLLQVRCNGGVRRPDGIKVDHSSTLSYLGSTLSNDGRVGSELSRRIGAAKGDFEKLQQVWKHSSLSRYRKIEIFVALIESKLLYSLATACYTVAELRRLDGFQSRCLRSILNIGSSFLTRIPNIEVRRRAGLTAASHRLCQQQLIIFGKIMRSDTDGPLKQASFIPGTLQSTTDRYVRRVGRPRKEWIPTVLQNARRVVGNGSLEESCTNAQSWKKVVKASVCFF